MIANMAQPKTGRKLSRAQVQEILERNARLYKSDENFVAYLVELGLYLLEYEYDWSDSGAEPPPMRGVTPPERLGTPMLSAPRVSSRPVGSDSTFKGMRPAAITPFGRNCPHCGVRIGDELICPSCRNLTR